MLVLTLIIINVSRIPTNIVVDVIIYAVATDGRHRLAGARVRSVGVAVERFADGWFW